jgi:DNA-binding transcriptional regulator YhcF (GntR family)
MLIRIDLQSDEPIYQQLFNRIVEGIASGALQPGETLPSVRSLAADLGINLHTVNKAYTCLKQEGYIQIHRQKGALVQRGPMPAADEEFIRRMEQRLRPLVAEAICRGVDEGRFREMCGRLYRQFGKGEMTT